MSPSRPDAAGARAIAAHALPSRQPLRLRTGDLVAVSKRDTEWPAFVFVECGQGEGWIPSSHLSGTTGEVTVIRAYDTQELATQTGDALEILEADDGCGWAWCRGADGREGWVPSRVIESSTSLPD